MPDTISDFQALTTRCIDRLPATVARSLDQMISGLERSYDQEQAYNLIYQFNLHLQARGLGSHQNLTFDDAVLTAVFLEAMLAVYNAMSDPAILQVDFDSVFAEHPHVMLDLLRRNTLNGLNYVEGVGAKPIGTNYYTGTDIIGSPVNRDSLSHVFTAASAAVLLGVASSGSSFYTAANTEDYPLPISGGVLLNCCGFGATPVSDIPLITLTGDAAVLHIDQTVGGTGVFKARATIGGDPEDVVTLTPAAISTLRRVLVTYSHKSIDLYALDATEMVASVAVKAFLQPMVFNTFQVHEELIYPHASGSYIGMTDVSIHGGVLSEATIFDLLSNGV